MKFKIFLNFTRKYLLVDPSELEERCMDGKLVIGMNRHREICTMQLSGNVLLHKDQVIFFIVDNKICFELFR